MKRMFANIKKNPPNKPHQHVLTIELKKYFLYLKIRIIVKDAIKPKPLKKATCQASEEFRFLIIKPPKLIPIVVIIRKIIDNLFFEYKLNS